jgi:hypothetical protein
MRCSRQRVVENSTRIACGRVPRAIGLDCEPHLVDFLGGRPQSRPACNSHLHQLTHLEKLLDRGLRGETGEIGPWKMYRVGVGDYRSARGTDNQPAHR